LKLSCRINNVTFKPLANDFKNTTFEYNGNQLISVKDDKKSFFFIYKNEQLVRTEYFAHGKMYNHREYEYDKYGQKTKTNIFNVNNELEYSIIYDYEYY